ncbi:MAG: amidohydrolase family protein [Alphaproteobacteria bacterium]
MQGKIALEEHFAIDQTVIDSERMEGGTDAWLEIRERLLDTEDLRLAEMDRHGIELAILSLNAPTIQAVADKATAVDLARKANDELAKKIAKRPDRFAGFAALPMQDPDAASRELTRCVDELGFKGAFVNGFSQVDGADSAIFYDIAEYRPFWACVQDLDVPFYLHPRSPNPNWNPAYRGHPWLMTSAWGFGAETSVHALRLITSGLFDEFPRLRIVLGHLGEGIPYDMWRIDHRIVRTPPRYPAKKKVSEYLRSNFYFTTSGNFHDPTLHCALTEMGADRIMFSVDYPFEQIDEAASWFDNTEMTNEDRAKIGRANANKLFKLDLA